MFQLVETLDELYRQVYLKVDFPNTGHEERDDFLHMCFLLCHRALLSAATATGSGMPEDAAATTRRALEAAKVALAIKADPDNFTIWKATDARKDRWKKRRQGDKPKGPLPLRYKNIVTEPLYRNLQAVIGTLSDFTVHFTPEHVGRYEWLRILKPDGSTEHSYGLKEDAVVKEFVWMAEQHRLIMNIFDRCLDGRLLKHPEVNQIAVRAMNLYKDVLRREGLADNGGEP